MSVLFDKQLVSVKSALVDDKSNMHGLLYLAQHELESVKTTATIITGLS